MPWRRHNRSTLNKVLAKQGALGCLDWELPKSPCGRLAGTLIQRPARRSRSRPVIRSNSYLERYLENSCRHVPNPPQSETSLRTIPRKLQRGPGLFIMRSVSKPSRMPAKLSIDGRGWRRDDVSHRGRCECHLPLQSISQTCAAPVNDAVGVIARCRSTGRTTSVRACFAALCDRL